MISRTFVFVLIACFTLAAMISRLQAQGVATARISGTLTDQSGAVLTGASVQATNLATGN